MRPVPEMLSPRQLFPLPLSRKRLWRQQPPLELLSEPSVGQREFRIDGRGFGRLERFERILRLPRRRFRGDQRFVGFLQFCLGARHGLFRGFLRIRGLGERLLFCFEFLLPRSDRIAGLLYPLPRRGELLLSIAGRLLAIIQCARSYLDGPITAFDCFPGIAASAQFCDQLAIRRPESGCFIDSRGDEPLAIWPRRDRCNRRPMIHLRDGLIFPGLPESQCAIHAASKRPAFRQGAELHGFLSGDSGG